MLKYSIKRVILALITAFIILTLTFFLVKSLGIADTTFGQKENVKFAFFMKQYNLGYVVYFDHEVSGFGKLLAHVHTVEQEYYFYERPLLEQYWNWLGNIVTKWDWGTSVTIQPIIY